MQGYRKGLTNYGDPDFSAFIRGAYAKGLGLTEKDLERLIIGIAQTWSELNPCHRNLREIAEAVKRGVWQAGGLPLEFPTISLGEIYLSPTAMLFRNLLSMDTEEMITGQPLDGAVLLGGCDKTLPAQLMGAASAGVPTLAVSAGPMIGGRFEGNTLGACSDCRGMWNEFRGGAMSVEKLEEVQGELFPSAGHCMVMGTASTMVSLTEALGMMLPGLAAIPAVNSRRLRLAEESGRRIVEMLGEGLTPGKIMTPRGVRERHPRSHGRGRLDERGGPSPGHRGKVGNRSAALPLRRSLADNADARGRSPIGKGILAGRPRRGGRYSPP